MVFSVCLKNTYDIVKQLSEFCCRNRNGYNAAYYGYANGGRGGRGRPYRGILFIQSYASDGVK